MIFLLYLQNNIETREIYKMKATKVLFIAQEITPYLPESEIANVCRYLPQGVQERGREIRTFHAQIREYQRTEKPITRSDKTFGNESHYR